MLPPPLVRASAPAAVKAVDLREAYATARGLAAAAPRTSSVGHRIVWVRGAAFGSSSLPADHYAVVGRHTHADIVLPEDPAVALRHVLLRSVRLPDGAPGLHALDLQTTLGMELEGGAKPRAFFARGPVAVRIGEYALVAFPNGVDAPESLAPELLPPVEVDEAAAMPLSPYPVASRSAEQRPIPSSRITVLPPISVLGERLGTPEPSYGDRTITLERGGKKATVGLTERELDAGVIIGRADKCLDMGLRAILTEDTNISRMHTLLLRERDAVFAFDLGSTQGTFLGADPHRVRRVALTNAGATLFLGHLRQNRVELYWHPLH